MLEWWRGSRFKVFAVIGALWVASLTARDLADQSRRLDVETKIKIEELNGRLHRMLESSSPTDLRSFAVSVLAGYATSTTALWWMGLEGMGPWFFATSLGTVGGVFGYAIKEQRAASLFHRLKTLKQSKAFASHRATSEKVSEVVTALLQTHRFETSVERWFYLEWVHAIVSHLHTQPISEVHPWAQTLDNIFRSVRAIERSAILQKDLPIALRASAQRDNIVGMIGTMIHNESPEAYRDWLEIQQLDPVVVKTAMDRFRQISHRHQLEQAALSWTFSGEPKRFFLRLQYSDQSLAPLVTLTDHSKALVRGVETLTWESLRQRLPPGLWLKFLDLGSPHWEYFLDDALVPYSAEAPLGRIHVTDNPFEEASSVITITSALQVKDLRDTKPTPTSPFSQWRQKCRSILGRHY